MAQLNHAVINIVVYKNYLCLALIGCIKGLDLEYPLVSDRTKIHNFSQNLYICFVNMTVESDEIF